MNKSYFKSPIYTIIFTVINIIVTALLVVLAIYSINENGEYKFDFAWMIIFFVAFFFIIFNAHFVYIGAYSRVVLSKDGIEIKKFIRTNTHIKWHNIIDIRVANEIRHYIKTVDIHVIVIDAYDDITKEDVSIQMDHRKKLYDAIINGANSADDEIVEKMEKYFE